MWAWRSPRGSAFRQGGGTGAARNIGAGVLVTHRYVKPIFLVLGRGLAKFKRYWNIIKCVLECPLDLHIYPFSKTKGGKIFREYLIYRFWVRLSGRKSHQLPTKLQFPPINMTDKLFEKL